MTYNISVFRWVKRDSYLPVGSQNLKAVAKVSGSCKNDIIQCNQLDQIKQTGFEVTIMTNIVVH